MFSGVFGLAWTEWARRDLRSGVDGYPGGWDRARPDHLVLVRSPAALRWREWIGVYVLVAELSTHSDRGGGRAVGGAAILGATGRRDYVIAWFAIVVGIHFLAFGRLFFSGFYWLGTALIAAGIAGTIVGLAGGGLGTSKQPLD